MCYDGPMPGDAFVDVTYRGLAVGEKLELTELGPTTAYLEAPQPLPVGATLDVATESGLTFSVDVIRVQEQVAGAEHAPGMRVVARELAGEVASWWNERAGGDDPVIPEPQTQPSPSLDPVEPDQPEAAPDDAAVAEAIEDRPTQRNASGNADQRRGEASQTTSKKNGESKGGRTQVMSVDEIQAALADGSGEIAVEDGGDGVPEAQADAKRTEVMNADEIRAIAEAAEAEAAVDDAQAAEAAGETAETRADSSDDSHGGDDETPSNGEKPGRGKRRRRRRKRRKRRD